MLYQVCYTDADGCDATYPADFLTREVAEVLAMDLTDAGYTNVRLVKLNVVR